MILNEISKFTSIANQWWQKDGPFKMLHEITPIRMKYITDNVASHFNIQESKNFRNAKKQNPFHNLEILDAGCGGGLLSLPLARLGAKVHGIDLGKENIEQAVQESKKEGLNILFENIAVQALEERNKNYDLVICSEVLEHVDDPNEFINSLSKKIKNNGLLIVSTINRTKKSKLFAIYIAEYLLKIMPRGTHSWDKFITPAEMRRYCAKANLELIDSKGMIFDLFSKDWVLTDKMDVNYFMTFKK